MYSSTPSGDLVIHLYFATGWITVPLVRPGRPWCARKEPTATVLWWAAAVNVTSWLSSLVGIVLPVLARLVAPWRRLLRDWTPGAIRVPGSLGGRRRRGTDPSAGTDCTVWAVLKFRSAVHWSSSGCMTSAIIMPPVANRLAHRQSTDANDIPYRCSFPSRLKVGAKVARMKETPITHPRVCSRSRIVCLLYTSPSPRDS